MVATDTVVGIVGALVLVAAMAGVFVYEYNNVPDGGSPNESERFAHLSADGDIDGDGIRNADDDDIDGDGLPNSEDEETVVVTSESGDLGARAEPAVGPSTSFESVLEEGVRAIRVTVDLEPDAMDPSGTLNGFQLSVDLDGAQLGTSTGASALEVSSTDVLAGLLTSTVEPGQGSLGGSFTIQIELIY